MIAIRSGIRVFLCREPTDMRKSINGLSIWVLDALGVNPQSGDIYVFWGHNRRLMKALMWDRNGFIVHYKRLEQGRFHIPKMPDTHSRIEMTATHFSWFMAGLDFATLDAFPELELPDYF